MTGDHPERTLSVVIPVYRGADSVERVVTELLAVCDSAPPQVPRLVEVVLVHDGAMDDSATVIQALATQDARITPVWLTRNFGQHAATLAGCSSTTGDWIVTMDEDGLHDPRSIQVMHAAAVEQGIDLVYAHATDHPHRAWRSLTSRTAKSIVRSVFGVQGAEDFSSFRLLDGATTRALAAYCGPGVYLDVALQWVFASAGRVATQFRQEYREASGYSLNALVGHFRRMVLTAGTRPLRIASMMGLVVATMGVLGAVVLVVGRLSGAIDVQGWTSVMVALATLLGVVLLVLGVIAEYLSMTLTAVSGRPPYLISGRPPRRPGSG